jgi:hypothetical protein
MSYCASDLWFSFLFYKYFWGNVNFMVRVLTLFLSLYFFSCSIFAQSSVDGLLRNGRSVTYYKNQGLYQRDLEPEENEYQQWAMAKTINIFKTVEISGYKRVDKILPDMEDILRSREDDKANLPIHFRGLLEFRPQSGTGLYDEWMAGKEAGAAADEWKVFILMEANVRDWKIQALAPFKPQSHEGLDKVWFSESAQVKFPYGRGTYSGPVTVLTFGAASVLTKATDSWAVKGQFPSPGMCSVSNIVVAICAAPERAMEIIETMDKAKVGEVLAFKEKWP